MPGNQENDVQIHVVREMEIKTLMSLFTYPIEKKFRNVTAPKFFKVCISTRLHIKLGYNCKRYSSKAEKNVFLKFGGI